MTEILVIKSLDRSKIFISVPALQMDESHFRCPMCPRLFPIRSNEGLVFRHHFAMEHLLVVDKPKVVIEIEEIEDPRMERIQH